MNILPTSVGSLAIKTFGLGLVTGFIGRLQIPIRIHFSALSLIPHYAVHCGSYCLPICSHFRSPMVPATSGEHSPFPGFSNCPRATATDILTHRAPTDTVTLAPVHTLMYSPFPSLSSVTKLQGQMSMPDSDFNWNFKKSKLRLSCDRQSVGQSVLCHGNDLEIFVFLYYYGAPFLTRGWVCNLRLLLDPASAVFLGSESRRIHDLILMSEFWDPFSLQGQIPLFISPRKMVAQIHPQALTPNRSNWLMRLQGGHNRKHRLYSVVCW
jgi:hypothetical protein